MSIFITSAADSILSAYPTRSPLSLCYSYSALAISFLSILPLIILPSKEAEISLKQDFSDTGKKYSASTF